MAWGSLWTVDRQLSLSDKLPARERKRERVGNKKKMSEIKSGPTALCDGEGLHFTVKRGGKGGGVGGGGASELMK